MGALAGLAALWVGCTGDPVPLRIALLGLAPALLAGLLPEGGRLGAVAAQTSAVLLLLRIPASSAGVPVVCAGVVLCGGALVSWRHARLVSGIAWVEAVRLSLLPAASAAWQGANLFWVGVAAGAACQFQRRHGWLVALGWGLLGLRGHQIQALPVEGPNHALALARTGLLDDSHPSLRHHPWTGVAALTQLPGAHGLAADLIPLVGVRPLLWAGWHPTLSVVPVADRTEVVEALDALGRGGEALRLARSGAAHDPRLAWWSALLAREQHEAEAGAVPAAVEGVPSLQGAIQLDWTFLTEDTREQLVHLPHDLRGLVLETEGQHHEGPPELQIEACGAAWQVAVPEGAGRLVWSHALPAGPCRLRVTLVADRVGPSGDRNAVLRSVEGVAAGAQVFKEK